MNVHPAPMPMLRRAGDHAAFGQPAFTDAVTAAFDHAVREHEHGRPILSRPSVEQLCRTFLTHFIALGGRL